MCGIGGKVSFDERPSAALAERMNDVQRHRGPDASGVYAAGPALLAHRRLSVLDPREAGDQPMSNADGTVHIVFNGEIYNYRELRDRLPGYTFRSETDTEVLLYLFEEYGVECLEFLRGMFAFAVWDERAERLFLARDRTGQKPLYYHHVDDSFRFGSTIKAILADEAVPAQPDLPAIRSYLTYQYVPHPRTGFEGIRQVSPGEYLVVSRHGVEREQYWSLSFTDKHAESVSRLTSTLRERIREAVRLRLRSDVPLGVFLSGGLDSSIVTATAAEILDEPVETFSMGFDVETQSELGHARTVADHFDTDHHEYSISPDAVSVLPELVDAYEMPFGDSSALPTYLISRATAGDVTVALNGTGGDELFAGYRRYKRDQAVARVRTIPAPIRRLLRSGLGSLPAEARRVPGPYLDLAHRALVVADEHDDAWRYARYVCRFLGADAREIWTGDEPADEIAFLRSYLAEADGGQRLDRVLYADTNTYLPGSLLTKVDRASMAHSLEVRSPFLDHELMEFVAAIPGTYKLRRGRTKWLLKRAYADVLPREIIERPKDGFGSPVNEWFRGQLREFARDHLERLGDRYPFDAAGLSMLIDEHAAGVENHGVELWQLVMLEQWYERFIDDA